MAPPAYRACCYCGEMFGSSSLSIHLKRCRSRPLTKLTEKPGPVKAVGPLSRSRSPEPHSPLPMPALVPLMPCRHCGRTFHPERVATHERACIRGRHPPPQQHGQHNHASGGGDHRRLVPTRAHTKWRQQHEEFLAAVRSNQGSRRLESATPRRRWPASGGAPPQGVAAGMAKRPVRVGGNTPPPRPHPCPPSSPSPVTIASMGGGFVGGRIVTLSSSPPSHARRSPHGSTRRPNAAQRHAMEWQATQTRGMLVEDSPPSVRSWARERPSSSGSPPILIPRSTVLAEQRGHAAAGWTPGYGKDQGPPGVTGGRTGGAGLSGSSSAMRLLHAAPRPGCAASGSGPPAVRSATATAGRNAAAGVTSLSQSVHRVLNGLR